MKQKHLSKLAAFQAALALFCLVAGTAASAESLYWYTTRDCSGDATFAASLNYVPGTSGAGSYRILGETECRPIDVIKAQQAARYAAHWPSWSYSYDFSTNTGIGYSGVGVTYVVHGRYHCKTDPLATACHQFLNQPTECIEGYGVDTSGGLYNRRCKEYVTCEPGCSIDSFKCMSDRMCTFVQTVDQTLPYACVALYSAAGGLAGLAVCTAAAPTTVGAVAVCTAAASAVTGVVVYARDVCN